MKFYLLIAIIGTALFWGCGKNQVLDPESGANLSSNESSGVNNASSGGSTSSDVASSGATTSGSSETSTPESSTTSNSSETNSQESSTTQPTASSNDSSTNSSAGEVSSSTITQVPGLYQPWLENPADQEATSDGVTRYYYKGEDNKNDSAFYVDPTSDILTQAWYYDSNEVKSQINSYSDDGTFIDTMYTYKNDTITAFIVWESAEYKSFEQLYENGQKVSLTSFENGIIGSMQLYDENESIKQVNRYNDDGMFIDTMSLYENGMKTAFITWESAEHKKFEQLYENNLKVSLTSFENGIISSMQLYDESEKLKQYNIYSSDGENILTEVLYNELEERVAQIEYDYDERTITTYTFENGSNTPLTTNTETMTD